MLEEDDYLERAGLELRRLVAALDSLGEVIDPEFSGDIITIEFGDGQKFVINSHRAARQIWMAARRRAWHFDYDPDVARWWSSKENSELWQTVSDELSAALGSPVQLSPKDA